MEDQDLASKIVEAAPADVMTVVRDHLTEQKAALLARVEELEAFLGFVDAAGDLAVRVGKLEHFTGIHR